MNNVLIDDRRIKVDFSQSVYHLWKQYRRFGKLGQPLSEAASHPDPQSHLETRSSHHRKQGDYKLMLDEKKLERGALKRRDRDDRERHRPVKSAREEKHRDRDMRDRKGRRRRED